MGTTTTTQIPSAVSEFYDKVLLIRALPFLAHDKWGQRRPIPKGNSDVIKFRRYNALGTATTPLSEGVTPSSTQLAKTDITATIQTYGAYVELSDKVSMVNVESVVTEATELLGEQAGQSIDEIIRDVLVAGSNVLYSNGSARNAVNTILSATVLDKTIRWLGNLNAKMHTKVIKGGTGIGTLPIRPAYFAIVHPDVQYDLDNLSGFISVEKYASQGPVVEGEIGAYKNIRFVSSTKAKVWTGAGATSTTVKNTGGLADVYAILVFGTDAYGITELRGEGLRQIIKPLGSAGSADPLDQRATVGWKAYMTAKILNDAFMVRIECAASL